MEPSAPGIDSQWPLDLLLFRAHCAKGVGHQAIGFRVKALRSRRMTQLCAKSTRKGHAELRNSESRLPSHMCLYV